MEIIISPSTIRGSIQGPASKSSMQRACAAALLAKGETIIRSPGHSKDDKAALDVIRGLGAQTQWLQDGSLKVVSHGVDPVSGLLDCGESGLGIRMFTPIAGLSGKQVIISGSGSLASRPMDFFDEILPHLAIQVQTNHGRLPIRIQGPLKPRNIEVDGSLSSQFLTGLLMAYGAAGAQDAWIKVKDLTSRPYIDLTLKVMEKFGLKVPENKHYESFYFDPSPAAEPAPGRIYEVEGDWSGGAFLLVAGVIAGELTIGGLDPDSVQADRAILQALTACGAVWNVQDDQLYITGARGSGGKLRSFQFDATDCPDLFPPLVSLAAYCEGTTRICGVNRLAHKESNRALTLQEEFGKMGVSVSLHDNWMHVEGGSGLKGTRVHSHHDHRIAMACAVAALGATGETRIDEAQAIEKSYPGFYDDLIALGARIGKPMSTISIQP